MKIVVLVKHVPDYEEPRHLDEATGLLDRSQDGALDEINSRALSWALGVRKQAGGEVIALTMGPEKASEALRQALALGADEAVQVVDPALAGSDTLRTCQVLAAALQQEGFDLVVAGDAASDGQVGALPAMLAESLGLPHVSYASEVEVDGSGVTAVRDDGHTRYRLQAPLPAIVSVREAIAEPEVPGFRGILGAKRKPRRTLALADLGLSTPSPAAWTITSVVPKAQRDRGEIITDEGDAAERIADYLAANAFIGK